MLISQKVSQFNLFDQIVREAEENGRTLCTFNKTKKKVKLLTICVPRFLLSAYYIT